MITRSIQNKVFLWIEREEILFLNGPRQVGKTTLMKAIRDSLKSEGKETLYLNLENPNDLALTEDYELFLRAVLKPKFVRNYIFLDEIQLHSRPSNFLKFLFDEYRFRLKLIVSGSANLHIKAKLQDSLVGRKKTFHLAPFNFGEFLEAKEFQKSGNPLTDEKRIKILLDEYLLYGGLPKIVLENDIEMKRELLNEYTATYINRDIRHMIAENHVLTFNNLLIFLAKIMGALKNNSEISKELGVNHITLSRYLDLLRYTYVVDFLKPYFTNEINRIRKAEKVYFFDNGVRNSLLSNFASLDKRNDAGALFENVVLLHLKEKYASEHVSYLRTVSDNELDFVCKTEEGSVDLFEAKFSRFETPNVSKGFKELIKALDFHSANLINQNLSEKKSGVEFVSFYDFARGKDKK